MWLDWRRHVDHAHPVGEAEGGQALRVVKNGLAEEVEAPIHAAMRADELLEAGDLGGRAVWLTVPRAIEVLLEQNPLG